MNESFDIIVVEGKTDKDLIETFLDCEIVTTNGSEVSHGTIEYLQTLSKTRKIVVLTDPDAPGKRIRDIINAEVPGCLNAYIEKTKAIKGKKVGVAESSKEAILEALDHLIPNTERDISNLSYGDLCDLGLADCKEATKARERLEGKLHIGHTNAKTFLKRCRCLGLEKEDLEKLLHE